MVTTPQPEEPGFETDVNELPDDNQGPEDTLEDKPVPDGQNPNDLEEAQKDGARSEKRAAYIK